jgi:large subunit ribosomal protein L23
MIKLNHRKLIDLIRKPLITDKTTKLLEENQYCFAVDRHANKIHIKQALEYIFDVKIIKINTLNTPIKKRTVGKFIGKRAQYKKAIITLAPNDNINLFPET